MSKKFNLLFISILFTYANTISNDQVSNSLKKDINEKRLEKNIKKQKNLKNFNNLNYQEFKKEYINLFNNLHHILYRLKADKNNYEKFLTLKQKFLLLFKKTNTKETIKEYISYLFHIYFTNIKFLKYNSFFEEENKKIINFFKNNKQYIQEHSLKKLINKII